VLVKKYFAAVLLGKRDKLKENLSKYSLLSAKMAGIASWHKF